MKRFNLRKFEEQRPGSVIYAPRHLPASVIYRREMLDCTLAIEYTVPRESPWGMTHEVVQARPGRAWFVTSYHQREEDARKVIDEYATIQFPLSYQRQCLQPDRFEYVNRQLAQTWGGVAYKHFFERDRRPDAEPGCVGVPMVHFNGLGIYYMAREVRQQDGSCYLEYPEHDLWTFLEPVVMDDIRGNYWGTKDYAYDYPVAPDVANAAYPGTYPAYGGVCGLPWDEREQWQAGNHPYQGKLHLLPTFRYVIDQSQEEHSDTIVSH